MRSFPRPTWYSIFPRPLIPLLLFTLVAFPFMPAPRASAFDDPPLVPQPQQINVRLPDGSIIECGPANDGSGNFEILNPASAPLPQPAPLSPPATSFISEGPFGIFLALFGILAQIIFMSRFLVQWLASEKAQKSVVPVTFWWLSIAGATMLLIYFILRHEPIGILGQSFGWIVYSRNLFLIYRPAAPPPAPAQ